MTYQNFIFFKYLFAIGLFFLIAMLCIFGFYPVLEHWPKAVLATTLAVLALKYILPYPSGR